MKRKNKFFCVLGVLIFVFIFSGIYIFSGNPIFAKSENSCLKCHSVKRLPKILENGEKMELYIDKEAFLKSVHGSISCTDCHTDIDTAKHPRPIKIKSRLAFTKEVSQNCANCHPQDSLSPIHKGMLKEGKVTCAECHGSHYIKSIAELKKESEKCLDCHNTEGMTKVLENKEVLDLYVNKEKFLKSVHGKLGCLFCHNDINPLTHPEDVKKIESKKIYSNKMYKNCLNCHPLNSLSPIHKGFLKEDRMVCFGCHGNHYVKSKTQWAEETDKCLKCHSVKRLPKVLPNGEKMELYVDKEAFKKTVHGKVGCWACHQGIDLSNHPRPISIASKRAYTEKVVAGCFRCHPRDVISKHPGHAKIINRKDLLCIECHGYHKNQSIKEWKKKVSINEYCMSCHKFDVVKILPSKEKLSVKVDPSQIKQSVHSGLSCTDCHTDFSKEKHPAYSFKNKKEYTINLSRNCKVCHTDKELQKNPAHYAISKTATCVECHGAHNVKPAKIPSTASEREYCMTCHSKALTKMMENKEVISIKVDDKQILQSAHGKLKCSDCHKGFSLKTHPVRSFKSVAEYRSKAQDMCNSCHAKEVSEYNLSIHAAVAKKGHSKAPDCLSCHGYHNVRKITTDNVARYQLCVSCHEKEAVSFQESVHYKAFKEGKKDAPICSSCHGAHKVLPTNLANLNNSCITCHKDVKISHNKWLYNPPFKLKSFVDVHFAGSSCAVCHVSGEKAVILTLFTSENKPLTVEELAKIANWEKEKIKEKIDLNNDNLIQKEELWKFVELLKKRVKVKLKGRLDIVNANDAHKVLSKEGAIKDCAICHSPTAQFVGKLEINKEEGKVEKIALERSAVNSVYAIPNIKDFYVLGLTKINILDALFVIALIAGIAVVAVHVFLRIITIPVRRKRKEGH